MILAGVASLFFAFHGSAYAEAKKNPNEVRIKRLEKGEVFLGGKPPRLQQLSVIQEVEKDGNFYYRMKAIIDRCSGDSNGSLVLFKAKDYGTALLKLLGVDPARKATFDLFFPQSIDKTRFPPVLMVYSYDLITRNSDDARLVPSEGTRRPKGRNKFVESLSQGLPPGTHEFIIESEVDVGDHPVKDLFDIIEWVEFLMDPVGSVIDSLAESTEYFSSLGLGKALLKYILVTKATTSRTVYQIEVLAKVPDVRGLKPSDAVTELARRRLSYTSKNTLECKVAKKNIVVRQKPNPGARLKKDAAVELTICRQESENPTPTPTPDTGFNDTYAAWIQPDKLTCCTTPDGIFTYAYQWGLDKNLPANATLLSGGYFSQYALEQWVCNRPVYYHYWARNYAIINGYTVSALPCTINTQ